jgi:TonB family protein
MRLDYLLHGLAVAALIASPAQARGLRKMQPTSQWVVNYDQDTCRLAREFGDGKQRVTVIFEQFVPGDIFQLTFLGRAFDPSAVSTGIKAAIRFGPNEAADEDNSVTFVTVGSTPGILLGAFQRLAPPGAQEKLAAKQASDAKRNYEYPPIGSARERAATLLQLSKVLPYDIELETGPMDRPLDVLRQCSWDTVKSWGLSIDEQKGLTQKAYPSVPSSSWLNVNDYPKEMLNQGYEGIVNFRLIVDASGAPTSCHVQSSTRPKAFDDIVCQQVLKKARFHPALDANGKPVKSYYRQSAYFRIAH